MGLRSTRHQRGVRYVCAETDRPDLQLELHDRVPDTLIMIATRIQIAVGIAVPASSLCIQRALYSATAAGVSSQKVSSGRWGLGPL
jgi:hypothetical protein